MTYESSTTTFDERATGPTDPLAQAGQQAGESAGHLAGRAADIGFQQADRGKEQAAQGISQVATSIRRVGEEMQGEQPAIANAAQTAADQAERIATYLQQTDAREILASAEDVARRQPLIFLGGAFLLGLAATRLIKAGGGDNGESWRTYGTRTAHGYSATGPGGRGSFDELPSEGV